MSRLQTILNVFLSFIEFISKLLQINNNDGDEKKVKNIVQIVVKNPQIGGPTLYVAEKLSNIPTESIPAIYPVNKSIKFVKSDEFTYVAKISAYISELPELINTLSALGFYVYIPSVDEETHDKI